METKAVDEVRRSARAELEEAHPWESGEDKKSRRERVEAGVEAEVDAFTDLWERNLGFLEEVK